MSKQAEKTIKEIHIQTVTKETRADTARLTFLVTVGGRQDALFYEVESKYAEYLCDEVADGVIVTLLPYAIRGGYDIVSDVPISTTLYYRLTEQLIPQLALCHGAVHATEIKATCVDPGYTPSGVATAISCGVDSFTTLYEYTEKCQLPDYRLTHLTFFENGAHHKGTWEYAEDQAKVFEGQLAHVTKFCKENGYELVSVRSNLATFLVEMFWKDSFDRTHTYRNVGFALMLQKLFKTYFYSAGHTVDEFSCSLNKDPAGYERFLLPHLCTESTVFYNSNRAWTRNEKIQQIAQFPQSYDYLLVCYAEDENCGKCLKCIRTLIELDFLGVLDRYKNSFDVEHYKKNHNWYMTRMYAKRHFDEFMMGLVQYAKEHEIHIPLHCKLSGIVQGWGYGGFLFLQKIKRKLTGK